MKKIHQQINKNHLQEIIEIDSPHGSENCTADSGRIRLPNPTELAHLDKKDDLIFEGFCGSKP